MYPSEPSFHRCYKASNNVEKGRKIFLQEFQPLSAIEEEGRWRGCEQDNQQRPVCGQQLNLGKNKIERFKRQT